CRQSFSILYRTFQAICCLVEGIQSKIQSLSDFEALWFLWLIHHAVAPRIGSSDRMISHRNAAIKRKMAPLLIAMVQPKYFAISGTRTPPTPPTAFPPVLRMPPAEEA